MATITLKINQRTSYGKALWELIKVGINEKKGVEEVKEKSPYNPEFVKQVLDAYKNDKRYEVKDVEALWESL